MQRLTVSQSGLIQGLSSNAIQTAWQVGLQVASIPVLYRLLGPESFAYISMFLAAQAVVAVLDLGFTTTVMREVSGGQGSSQKQLIGACKRIYSLTGTILVLGGLLAVLIYALAPAPPLLVAACSLAYAGVRWPSLFWLGILRGLEHHGTASLLGSAVSTVRIVGAIVAAWLSRGEWSSVLLWNIVAAGLETTGYSWAASRASRRDGLCWPAYSAGAAFATLRSNSRMPLQLAGTSLAAALLKNTDRLVLAPALLGLGQAGVYGALVGITAGLAQIASPVFTTLVPRLSRHFSAGDSVLIRRDLLATSQLCALLLGFPFLALTGCGQAIATLWLGHAASDMETFTLQLLMLAAALNVVMQPLYALQIAAGKPDLMLQFNVIGCLWVIPLQLALGNAFGPPGLAAGWLAFNVAYVFIQPMRMTSGLLKGHTGRWAASALAFPLLLGLPAAMTCRAATDGLDPVYALAFTGLGIFFSIIFLLATGTGPVQELRAIIKDRRRKHD